MHFCQLVLRTAIHRARAPCHLVIEDGPPGVAFEPNGQAAVAGYVDQYLAVSTDDGTADRAFAGVASALEASAAQVPPPPPLPGLAAESCGVSGMELRRGRWIAIKGRSA